MAIIPGVYQAKNAISDDSQQGSKFNSIVNAIVNPANTSLLTGFDPVIEEVSGPNVGTVVTYMPQTVSGTPPLALSNSAGQPLQAWSVDVLPYQEGTGDPSPDNVRPIHGTDKLNIYTYETLADGYIQVEYAESNSTLQYVETDVVPFAGMGFSCTYYVNSFVGTNDYGCIFGARLSSNVDDFQLTSYSDNPQVKLGLFRWGTANQYGAGIIRQVKQTASLINGVLTLPDGSTTEITAPSSFTTNIIMLHALNNGTSGASQFCRCRIYDFIVYNGDAVYRHFVPCRRTSDNTVGYYETETQTFIVPLGGNLIAGDPVGSSSVVTLPQTVYTGTIGSEGGECRWGEVDLGTLNWTYITNRTNPYFRATIPEMKSVYSNAGNTNVMCEGFTRYIGTALLNTADLNSGFNCTSWEMGGNNHDVGIVWKDYTTVEDFKNAVTGMKLIFELTTPTTFSAPSPTIPTPTGTAAAWATAEDGIVDWMEVTYVGKA